MPATTDRERALTQLSAIVKELQFIGEPEIARDLETALHDLRIVPPAYTPDPDAEMRHERIDRLRTVAAGVDRV